MIDFITDEWFHNFIFSASYWALQMGFNDMITKLNLPQSKAATAQEYLDLMMAKNKNYVLPPPTVKKIVKKGEKKGSSTSKSRSKSKSKSVGSKK